MITVRVEGIIRVMKYIRRISFVFCLFASLFFLYLGYMGVGYELNDFGMTLITVAPLLILFTSGRWWESLVGKEAIGINIVKGKNLTHKRKPIHTSVTAKDVYASEAMHF